MRKTTLFESCSETEPALI